MVGYCSHLLLLAGQRSQCKPPAGTTLTLLYASPILITQKLPYQPHVLAYITIILATQAPPGVSTYTYALFVHDFNQNWKSVEILVKIPNTKFQEYLPCGGCIVPCTQIKLTVTFH
jgi:hypothetical protein